MTQLSCNTCKALGAICPDGEHTVTVCRRKSPVAALVPDGNGGLRALTVWPQVDKDIDYCCEHQASEACGG